MNKWKAAQFLIACAMGFWAASAFGTESLHSDGCGTRFPAVGWCQHQTAAAREAEMLKVNTETISNEIAEFIGPNWRDYRPIAEIVSVFVSTFGHVHIDAVPERVWAPWIRQQQLRDTVRNYADMQRAQGSTEYRNGQAGYVRDGGWYPASLDF